MKRSIHLMQYRSSPDMIMAFFFSQLGDQKAYDCIFVWLGRPGKLPAQYADWHPDFLFKRLLPKMKAAGVTDEQIRSILLDNPRRFFGGAQQGCR